MHEGGSRCKHLHRRLASPSPVHERSCATYKWIKMQVFPPTCCTATPSRNGRLLAPLWCDAVVTQPVTPALGLKETHDGAPALSRVQRSCLLCMGYWYLIQARLHKKLSIKLCRSRKPVTQNLKITKEAKPVMQALKITKTCQTKVANQPSIRRHP